MLKNLLVNVTPNMHKIRRESLASSVDSVMRNGNATVTGIGRGIRSNAHEKHNIKRADRLCSNKHLTKEKTKIYQQLTTRFIGAMEHPIILIDWSDMDKHKGNFLLRASLAFDGRSLPIYQEVHDINTREKPFTHMAFLCMLKALVPEHAKPIIVADAGFKTPWFRAVEALGWDFVNRVRRPIYCRESAADWEKIEDLYKTATNKPKAFSGHINKGTPFACQFILYKGKNKGRHKTTQFGKPAQSIHSKKKSKSANDPWLLVTSLSSEKNLAKRAVNIYKKRMQIEEEFRDMKSSLYGLGFEHHRSRKSNRIAILVLIITLANIMLTLIGIAMCLLKIHRQFQANTTVHRRVLSYHYLGMRGVDREQLKLHNFRILRAIHFLVSEIREANPND